MPFLSVLRGVLFALLAACPWRESHAQGYTQITVASTTSTEQSGLLHDLLPIFTQKTGIEVYVVAVGTGEALKSGERGECDVVLVHDRLRELEFMGRGYGSLRRQVMYNDFVLVGPTDDAAKIAGTRDAVAALRKIAEARAPFISRGDASGTDAEEKRLWDEGGARPSPQRDLWYREIGSGMEQTLAAAAAMHGYTLTDRATWLAFKDRRNLRIVLEGDPRLFNQYGVMLVNPALHPQVKAEAGMALIDWLTSREGQDRIAAYRIEGEQVFFPNYAAP